MSVLPCFAREESQLALLQRTSGVRRGAVQEPVARVSCGIPELDRLLGGGWPRGQLSELYGKHSSGKTTLALQLLATVTRAGETAVWIDAADALHPLSLVAAGVELPRVLWVRPQRWQEALRCAEIVLLGEGFPLVVLDWGHHSPRRASHASWIRLQRAAARAQAVLLVLAPCSVAGSFAALRVRVSAREVRWLCAGKRKFFQGLCVQAAIERNRTGPEGRWALWEVPRTAGSSSVCAA